MAKQVISPEEFIAEINTRLPDHHAYEAGMHVFLVPIGATGRSASGYDWEPKDLVTIGVIASIVSRVESEYVVDPHISRIAHN
jgi:hypothetical protein